MTTTCSLSFSGLHHEGFGQFLTEATLGVDQDTKGIVSARNRLDVTTVCLNSDPESGVDQTSKALGNSFRCCWLFAFLIVFHG